MLHTYTAYGLCVESELPIPEFLPDADGVAEISIRFGSIVAPALQATPSFCRCHITSHDAYLEWETGGMFLVRQGKEIIIDPIPGADEDILRTFLLGAAFGMLLHQRGEHPGQRSDHAILHASAVAMAGGAIVFIGDSGAGKSTTAALLQSHGYRLLSDDVTVLDLRHPQQVQVTPSFPQLRLWPESLESLGKQPSHFPVLNPLVDKRLYRSPEGFAKTPQSLLGIYVLDLGDTNSIAPLRGQNALSELMHNWYGARFGEAMFSQISTADHLKTFAELVNRVPVYELVRKDSLEEIHAIVPLLEAHVASISPEKVEKPQKVEKIDG